MNITLTPENAGTVAANAKVLGCSESEFLNRYLEVNLFEPRIDRLVDVRDTIDRFLISQQLTHPEYVRLPKAGEREPHTGLSRSTLDRLIRPQECNSFRPPVVSKSVRIRGGRDATRGSRLISLASLLDYLNRQSRRPSIGANRGA